MFFSHFEGTRGEKNPNISHPSPNWTQAAMKFIQSPGENALQEVDFLKRQQHENIIKYLDSFEENGSLFIVMEYCDRGTLTDFLSKVSAIHTF